MAKWLPEWTALLGTMPDRQLADQLGTNLANVYKHRKSEGIKPFRRHRHYPSISAATDDEIAANRNDVLAQRYGVSSREVTEERRKRRLGSRNGAVSRDALIAIYRRAAVAGMMCVRLPHQPRIDGAQSLMARLLNISRERVRQLVNEVTDTFRQQ